MSVEQLKAAAAELSDAERRELIGFLVALGREKTPAYWERIEAKIGDRDSGDWAAEEDLDRALHLDEPTA